ncbi:MAG: hypothetical protein RL708_2546 [Bacteroidota bacterium]|jgi:hypothetical protein
MKHTHKIFSIFIAVAGGVLLTKTNTNAATNFTTIAAENIDLSNTSDLIITDKKVELTNGKPIVKIPITFNNSTNNAYSFENLPSGLEKRMAQIFTTTPSDLSSTATVSLDAAFVGNTSNISNLRLIMGSDNNFANAEVYMPTASINGGAIEFQNVNLNAMKKFFAIAFADKDEHPNITINDLQVVNNGNKQYSISWKAIQDDNLKGTYKISYVNGSGEKVYLKKVMKNESGLNIRYDINFSIKEEMDMATFVLEYESENKSVYSLGTVNDESDADGEYVELISEENFTALKIKTVAGSKDELTLKLYDEKGNQVADNQPIEVLQGASQIIPIDLPDIQGMYYAVLSSGTSSRKKKKVFKVIHS